MVIGCVSEFCMVWDLKENVIFENYIYGDIVVFLGFIYWGVC